MPDDALAHVDRHLAAHRQEQLEGLRAFLRIPSVSADPGCRAEMRRAAEFLVRRLRAASLDHAAAIETPGHPVVYADWLHAPGAPTALVYGHYDVQPADPLDLWTAPPFEPAIRGGRLYARGIADDKGQVWMHVLAAEALLRTSGRLPLNLRFVFEGEEEVDSLHLKGFVAQRRAGLACDAVVVSDSNFYAPGVPAIVCGLRGLCELEVTVRGPARDLHSGDYGGAVQNPLHALARLIAALHGEDGRVAVPGFYDAVVPPDPEERAELARLPFDEGEFRRSIGVAAAFGEAGYSAPERIRLRPTVEVNGMWGGFQGAGGKTIIPAEARAKISCRLVPAQDPAAVLDLLEGHLRRRCPEGARLEIAARPGARATAFAPDSPFIAAAARALRRVYGRPPVFLRSGGSIGAVPTLEAALGAAVVLAGFGLRGDRIHAPDESLDLGNYDSGQRAIAAMWLEFAGVGAGGGGRAPTPPG